MMKTKFFYVAALILGLAFTTTSCSSDDDNPTVDPANIEYTPENASSWHNYMKCSSTSKNRCNQSLQRMEFKL